MNKLYLRQGTQLRRIGSAIICLSGREETLLEFVPTDGLYIRFFRAEVNRESNDPEVYFGFSSERWPPDCQLHPHANGDGGVHKKNIYLQGNPQANARINVVVEWFPGKEEISINFKPGPHSSALPNRRKTTASHYCRRCQGKVQATFNGEIFTYNPVHSNPWFFGEEFRLFVVCVVSPEGYDEITSVVVFCIPLGVILTPDEKGKATGNMTILAQDIRLVGQLSREAKYPGVGLDGQLQSELSKSDWLFIFRKRRWHCHG